MKLPHELTPDKAASFALSWAITWRVILVVVVITSLLYFVPLETRIEHPILFLVINLLILFALIWAWIHRGCLRPSQDDRRATASLARRRLLPDLRRIRARDDSVVARCGV